MKTSALDSCKNCPPSLKHPVGFDTMPLLLKTKGTVMEDHKRECYFVCENRWFDGDCSGDAEIMAVKLDNLTFHEIFEVFESAVNRKVASFYAHNGFGDEAIAFQDRNAYLHEIRKEVSTSLGEFLYSCLSGIDASFQKIIHEHLDILINTHIKTYPIHSTEIDYLIESKIMPFLGERDILGQHILQRRGRSSVSEDQNKDNHDQLNQSLESIISKKQKFKEHLDAVKTSLLQRKKQLPSLELTHYGGGDAYHTTSYKIVGQGLEQPEPNWVELQLQDQAFRAQYPMIRKRLLNDLNAATSGKEILAKALYAVELKTISPHLMPSFANAKLIVERICNKFHSFALQIKKRHGNRSPIAIEDEYDVQDLLHAILRIFFDDVRPEEYTPSHAGGSARMDFLLKSEQIVIEVKMPRDGLTAKKLGEELTDDKAKYKNHPDCKYLICFVYDPDHRINNPAEIENDLSEQNDSMVTTVLIRPCA